MAADMYLSTSAESRHLARLALESATSSMIEIDQLVDAGVVCTFAPGGGAEREPIAHGLHNTVFDSRGTTLSEDVIWREFEAGYVEGLDPRLQALWSQIRAGDRQPSLDAIEEVAVDGDVETIALFIEVLENLRPRGVVENAVDVAAHAVADGLRVGDGLDLLCPTRLFASLVVAAVSDEHELRLHELGRAVVPGLDGLLLEDAVAIRLRSEAFDRWRRDIAIALERASSLRDRLGPDADTAVAIRESIANARDEVLGEARRSTVLSGGVSHLVSFVAGLLGGAVGNSSGGLSGAAMGAVGAAIPPAACAATQRWRAPAGFLRRHYLVFEPTGPRR